MQQKSSRSIVFVIVAVLSLGSTIASAALEGRAHGQLADARQSTDLAQPRRTALR